MPPRASLRVYDESMHTYSNIGIHSLGGSFLLFLLSYWFTIKEWMSEWERWRVKQVFLPLLSSLLLLLIFLFFHKQFLLNVFCVYILFKPFSSSSSSTRLFQRMWIECNVTTHSSLCCCTCWFHQMMQIIFLNIFS